MNPLGVYIVKRFLKWFFISIVTVVIFFLITQFVRISPVFAGSHASGIQILKALGLISVPVISWAFPLSFAAAVFTLKIQMEKRGELVAVDASGISRIMIVKGILSLLLILFLFNVYLNFDASWRCVKKARKMAMVMGARAITGKMEAGIFRTTKQGFVFYADERKNKEFTGVFFADNSKQGTSFYAAANRAEIDLDMGDLTINLLLTSGNAFIIGLNLKDENVPAAVTFEKMNIKVPLKKKVVKKLNFIPHHMSLPTKYLFENLQSAKHMFELERRTGSVIFFAVFSLFCLYLAFFAGGIGSSAQMGVSVIVFLFSHFAGRMAETIAEKEILTHLIFLMPIVSIIFCFFLLSIFCYYKNGLAKFIFIKR